MALDFLILYEHVVREYESILLLKAELARRGYTVELRQLLDRKKLKYFTLKKPEGSGVQLHVRRRGHQQPCVQQHRRVQQSGEPSLGADAQRHAGGRRVVQLRRNAKNACRPAGANCTQQRLVAHGMQEKNAP